jgi:catechol 2,3-dioxygenase
MTFTPQFGDIAHLGHIELLTPQLEASVAFFANVIGLEQTAHEGKSVYFRAWGDYELCTLKLTAAKTAGLGHIGLRVRSQQILDAFTTQLEGAWTAGDVHHGPAFRCSAADGHNVELYFETRKYQTPPHFKSRYKNMPRCRPSAVTPLRLDHLNILTSSVEQSRHFFQTQLGMKLTEQIVFDGGIEMGAWVTATNKSYDVAMTRDHTGRRGRLHHITYFMETREDVLKMADILVDAGVFIETGPHKHSIGQTFFLYCYEPGGNRVEFASGGYSIFDPDWRPVVWNEADRKLGQAWGLKTIESFHTYGTPAEESI